MYYMYIIHISHIILYIICNTYYILYEIYILYILYICITYLSIIDRSASGIKIWQVRKFQALILPLTHQINNEVRAKIAL